MSRITHLKIKIKNLADEARIIRHEEKKALEHGSACLRKSRDLGEKSFSETATPFSEYAIAHYRTYRGLYDHRTGIVRDVARVNLLAYGFLRGRPYARMENKTGSIPDFKDILKHAKNFTSTWGDEEKLEWDVWLAEAKAHLSAQHPSQAAYLKAIKLAA